MFSVKGNIVTDERCIKGYLTIDEGKIIRVDTLCPDCEIVDMGDCFVLPGFIDLHIHGIHDSLVDNGSADLSRICQILPKYGVTAFLPTVAPRKKGDDADFLSILSKSHSAGAQILGFHLEGPFLALGGALSKDVMAEHADLERVVSLIEAAAPYKAIFSVSPEIPGSEKLISRMSMGGTPVFITHTAASVSQTDAAIMAGASHATHFYDVYPCPGVTEPGVRPAGVVEAVLANDNVSVDFILDGVHADPVVVRMALKCKPDGKVALITDANVGAGLGAGKFLFGNCGEIEFEYAGAPARSVTDGTLAGSGLTMDKALRNAVDWLHLDLPQAVKLVSGNPARVLKVDNCKGRLAPGYDADFVIMDEGLNVCSTWVGGKCCFQDR